MGTLLSLAPLLRREGDNKGKRKGELVKCDDSSPVHHVNVEMRLSV